MIDLSPLFFLLGVVCASAAVVACFGIVFGFQFRKGQLEIEINKEKVKKDDTISIRVEKMESSLSDLDARVRDIEDEK